MSNEMTVYEGGDIQVSRSPEVVLEEATKAAKALGTVLAGKKKKVMMNGEQYLEFEDWQTVGRFYGVTAKIKETSFIDFGGVQGFEAKAVAIRADGMEISAAEAMCLNDEEKWRARPKYETLYILKDGSKQKDDPPKDQIVWIDNPNSQGKKMPKRERLLVGEEAVPLFQLKSMAQTRAAAKALRNVLAWVVVLAGYKPTPAEELDGQTDDSIINIQPAESKPPLKEPQKKQPAVPAGETQTTSIIVSEVDIKKGEKDGKPWTLYGVKDDKGNVYKTFSDTFADLARSAMAESAQVKITFTTNKNGNTITALDLEEREPGQDG